MLSAVQQLLDALSALGVTLRLIDATQQQLPQAGSGAQGAAPAAAAAGAAAVDCACGDWQQRMLFQELAQPVHAAVCGLLQQGQELAALVVGHVRSPSPDTRRQLADKVCCC
jgi:hypothetical protein